MSRWLEDLLAAIPVHLRQRRMLLALSGGLDSTLLLFGLRELHRAGRIGSVQALHVHHGLLDVADAWAEHVQALGRALGVPVEVLRVDVKPERGQGVEAAAREARYAALAGAMQAGEVLLTAHHLDDQAETLMLQLMRGAGVRGLSAMPALRPVLLREGSGWHVRPWLAVSRQELHDLAVQLGLQWLDDPSNQDRRFARNLLRHDVLPVLQSHWPQAQQTLARCAQRMATTEALLLDLARLDLQQARTETANALYVDVLQRLSPARLQNALRAWLLELGLPSPPEARLHEVSRVFEARADAMPLLAWPGGVLRRWRGVIYAMSDMQFEEVVWPGCLWSGDKPLELPELGVRLVPEQVRGSGVGVAWVEQGLWVCVRHAASLPFGASRKTLSKRLQECAVPPWLRGKLPLIYCNDDLLQISDLWWAAHARPQKHEDGIMIAVESLR